MEGTVAYEADVSSIAHRAFGYTFEQGASICPTRMRSARPAAPRARIRARARCRRRADEPAESVAQERDTYA